MNTRLCHVTHADPAEWSLYHSLRRATLWDGASRYYYREDHPDETFKENFAMIFYVLDEPVGVVRLDFKKQRTQAVIQRLAITVPERRKGYGTLLTQAAEDFARKKGCRLFIVNVAPGLAGFYTRLGYVPESMAGVAQGPRQRLTKDANRTIRIVERPARREPRLSLRMPLRLG